MTLCISVWYLLYKASYINDLPWPKSHTVFLARVPQWEQRDRCVIDCSSVQWKADEQPEAQTHNGWTQTDTSQLCSNAALE